MELKLTHHSDNDVLVIRVEGRVTSGDSLTAFRQMIRDQVANGRNKIVLDMSGVTYMDSSGLGELAMAFGTVTQMVCAACGTTVFRSEAGGWNKCAQCKSSERQPWGQLRIAAVTGPVKDLLEFSRLNTVLDLRESTEEAVASFTK